MSKGEIVAICTSPTKGIPKLPQGAATVAQFGIAGDFHCRAMRESFKKPGTLEPNTDRHISIVDQEVLDELNEAHPELCLGPGSLGENITVRGVYTELIKDGHTLRIGDDVILRVVEQNQPCKVLTQIHRLLPKWVHGKRGVLCAVESGVGEIIRPGMSITHCEYIDLI
jgi:hypothetical protein